MNPIPIPARRWLAVACLLPFSASPLSAAEDAEPPLNFTLKIGGQSVRVVPGTPVAVKGAFADPEVTLVPDAHRTFGYGGMNFAYPSNFAFEADFTEKGLKSWTLDGSNYVIMVQCYETVKVTPAGLAAVLKQTYGGTTKSEPVSHSFNGKKLEGVRVMATVAGTSFTQDVLALPAEKGSRFLILQDLSPQEKTTDAESKQALKLLGETLKP